MLKSHDKPWNTISFGPKDLANYIVHVILFINSTLYSRKCHYFNSVYIPSHFVDVCVCLYVPLNISQLL